MSDSPDGPKLLIIDDNAFARNLLAQFLSKRYWCVTAQSADEGLKILRREGPELYGAVLTDYLMPGKSGLDLLVELGELDSTLACVIVTAEGEKEVVAEALRLGAHGYLEKGGNLQKLLDSTAHAVATTADARKVRKELAGANEVHKNQQKLLGLNIDALRDRVKIFFRPWQQASGDFVSIVPQKDGTFLIIASDVSGHDLSAAYTSVYFQGMARGMTERGATVGEIFRAANIFLLRGWNRGVTGETSIAAQGAVIDPVNGTAEILNCGFPLPVLTEADGRPFELGELSSSPLGWFPELPAPMRFGLRNGQLIFWSDGLEDLADQLEVDRLACAYRLLDDGQERDSLMALARDDVLVFRADLRMNAQGAVPASIPILRGLYPGDQGEEIDNLQGFVERSLRLALPDLSADRLTAVVLCVREALLNGFTHGCQGKADETVTLRCNYEVLTDGLTVEVGDSGVGHSFDLDRHEQDAGALLLTEHRGLVLMKNLADDIIFSSEGRVVTMTFSCGSRERS